MSKDNLLIQTIFGNVRGLQQGLAELVDNLKLLESENEANKSGDILMKIVATKCNFLFLVFLKICRLVDEKSSKMSRLGHFVLCMVCGKHRPRRLSLTTLSHRGFDEAYFPGYEPYSESRCKSQSSRHPQAVESIQLQLCNTSIIIFVAFTDSRILSWRI